MKPDYSNSAIDLTNPNETKNLLLAWGKARRYNEECDRALAAITADLPEREALDKSLHLLNEAYAKVKEAIDRAGSYQDIPEGLYAIKQGRVSVTYDPVKVRAEMPEYAGGIIHETVRPEGIHGLLKGKLVTDKQVERCEIKSKLAPAYIIKVIEEEAENANQGTNGTPTLAESGQDTPGSKGKTRG